MVQELGKVIILCSGKKTWFERVFSPKKQKKKNIFFLIFSIQKDRAESVIPLSD